MAGGTDFQYLFLMNIGEKDILLVEGESDHVVEGKLGTK